ESRRAAERFVVEDDRLARGAKLDVELDPVRAETFGQRKSCDRVLRRLPGSTPMGPYQRPSRGRFRSHYPPGHVIAFAQGGYPCISVSASFSSSSWSCCSSSDRASCRSSATRSRRESRISIRRH